MLQRLFKPRPEKAKGRDLYTAVVAQARRPELYSVLGVEDRIDARFELYTIHVVLVMMRLKGEGPQAAEIGQAMFDAYLSALDHALRELGVGDLSVAKKMRRLGETIYTRTRALNAALDPLAESERLVAIVQEAIFPGETGRDRAGALAAYVCSARDSLARQPLRELIEGSLAWPQITA